MGLTSSVAKLKLQPQFSALIECIRCLALCQQSPMVWQVIPCSCRAISSLLKALWVVAKTNAAAGLFRRLLFAEANEVRNWARDNYEVGSPINSTWHPVCQDECAVLNMRELLNVMEEEKNGVFSDPKDIGKSHDLDPSIIARDAELVDSLTTGEGEGNA